MEEEVWKGAGQFPWVPEDIGLFHIRYFENGPVEPGYWSIGKRIKTEDFVMSVFYHFLFV